MASDLCSPVLAIGLTGQAQDTLASEAKAACVTVTEWRRGDAPQQSLQQLGLPDPSSLCLQPSHGRPCFRNAPLSTTMGSEMKGLPAAPAGPPSGLSTRWKLVAPCQKGQDPDGLWPQLVPTQTSVSYRNHSWLPGLLGSIYHV